MTIQRLWMKVILTGLLIGLLIGSITGCAGKGIQHNDQTLKDDRRMGIQRFKGNPPYTFRDPDDHTIGLNRENGWSGFDKDRINRWNDYRVVPFGVHNNALLEKDDLLATALTQLPEIHQAYIVLSEKNGYIGYVERQATGNQLGATDQPESLPIGDRIADMLKAAHPELEQVYVTVNPDFLLQLQQFADLIPEQGKLDGMPVQQFNTIAERVFPKNRNFHADEQISRYRRDAAERIAE